MLGQIMATPLTSLKAALWIALVISTTVYARDWFGSNLQYKCHCNNNNNCGVSGDCTDGCEKGWFGPQCQYVDLIYTENDGTTMAKFVDADDTTCNTDTNHKQVIVTFERTFPFTWLRLVVSSEGLSLDNIDVTFTDGNSNIPCTNMRSALIDSRTIDIHCDISVEVKKVSVVGDAIGYLCSLYVSGGRNVALKQTASQSTTEVGGPERAVDGNTNQDNNKGGSCSHTITSTLVPPVWSVTFSQNNAVNRFVIYNRGDCCPERLVEFTLTSRNNNQEKVFSYHDSGRPVLLVYTVTTATHTLPVKSVDITTSHVDDASATVPILALCEVEIYGDSLCSVGKYGRECEYECHCASNEKCFVSTGRCPDGCAVGYTGDTCNEPCPETYYGANCLQRCSYKCVGRTCDSSSGRCNQCPSGVMGDQCDQPCPATKYGPGCTSDCNNNCRKVLCNALSGVCTSCPSGKTGDHCDQDCPPTTYGSRCTGTCTTGCVSQHCSEDNGRCNECPSGKTGDQCDQDCLPIKYGSRCSGTCSTACVNQFCTGDKGRCNDCHAGWMGDLCTQPCPDNKYGPRCSSDCNATCVDQKCNGANGTCIQCPAGKTGDQCDENDCPHGKYGAACDQVCNQNCRNTDCDSNTGQCKAGCVPGYHGNMCQQQCEPGKYGKDCSSDCSEFCNTNGTRENESPCHHISGTCLYGCVHGYEGQACDAKPQSSSSDSELGVGVGIGVGVCVLVGIAILGVYFYRRRKSAQKARRERPPGYDPADPTTEEHNYSELFKSDDGYNLPTDVASSAVTVKVSSKNSTPDTVQYVNADVNAEVKADETAADRNTDATPYEDIDQITSEIDEGRKPKTREDYTGYANC